jgi:hypothetical protein
MVVPFINPVGTMRAERTGLQVLETNIAIKPDASLFEYR